MKILIVYTCAILSLSMSPAVTAEKTIIKPKDPEAAAAKILDIFVEKLETRPRFLMEMLAADRDRVGRLLRAAQKDRPTARIWAADFQMLFATDSFAGRSLRGKEKVAHFKRAFEYLRESYDVTRETLAKSPNEKLKAVLPGLRLNLARAAVEADELKSAGQHATQLLRDNTDRKNWNYGNIIHNANQILGRCALREGKLADAKAYLIKAGQTPGSPQLNFFGPQMPLAGMNGNMGYKRSGNIGNTLVV